MLQESLRLIGSPISLAINVATLPTRGRTVVVQPDKDASARLAEELGVLSVTGLRAQVSATRWQKDGVRLSGPLSARIGQTCVVTLAAFEELVETQIDALFVPDTSKLARKLSGRESHAVLIDPQSDDAPETFVPPELDIGGVVHEFLALSINPYPRSEEALREGFEASLVIDEGKTRQGAENPFAVLASLKNDGVNDT